MGNHWFGVCGCLAAAHLRELYAFYHFFLGLPTAVVAQ